MWQADLGRTRSDLESFRSTARRRQLQHMLQQFCLTHHVDYKQGMNEVSGRCLLLAGLSPEVPVER